MLNTPTYDYQYWDLKYYYQIHVDRQTELGNIPLKYDMFIKRLKKMNLHDAIYTPRSLAAYDRKPKTPMANEIRRRAKLREQNVMPKITTTKPKLLNRFISLFK